MAKCLAGRPLQNRNIDDDDEYKECRLKAGHPPFPSSYSTRSGFQKESMPVNRLMEEMGMRKLSVVIVASALLLSGAVATEAWAKLEREDKKQIKSMLKGKLFTRIDIPCETGRHAMGTFKAPLVEVSPQGANSDAGTGINFEASVFHARSAYWPIAPNDPVEVEEFDFEDDTIEIELEGVDKAEGRDSVILFVNITSVEDFQQAFDHAFSRSPLEDEHPEWSAEIKKAVAGRKLLPGMSKRQTFYITGTPVSVNSFQEHGKNVEIWSTRQDKGMNTGFWSMKAGERTGLPTTLRFEDGKLVSRGASLSQAGFTLDN
jgi:hypothetical protein